MVFFNIFLKTLGILSGFAVFIIVFNLIVNLLSSTDIDDFVYSEGNTSSKNIIASLSLNGPIVNNSNQLISSRIHQHINPEFVKQTLKKLENHNPSVLIIKLNSPGGTVTATSYLESVIKKFKEKNNTKIYFFTNEILASGGYWVSTIGDGIYAQYGSMIGSIGVSGPSWYYYNKPSSISYGAFGQTIKTENGIEIYNQSAGKYKDLYNPFRRPSNKELEHLQSIVQDIYVDFINKVSKSRKIEIQEIEKEIGGLIFTSKQARDKFLINDVIDYDELLKKIIKDENYLDYKIIERKQKENFFEKYLVTFINTTKSFSCEKLNNNFVTVAPLFIKSCWLINISYITYFYN